MIYNQRPNSSRLYSNKENNKINNLIKNNNIIDKIFNDNKRYFGFSQHPMNVNINSSTSLVSTNKPISAKTNIRKKKNINQFVNVKPNQFVSMKPKGYQ